MRTLFAYDPLAVDRTTVATLELTVNDTKRSRVLPIRVYLPQSTSPAPLVFFSHGLGGSRTMSSFLGEHWARRGYVAVFLQHPGSDDAVWREASPMQRVSTLKQAAGPANFQHRIYDVPAVLDQLTRWQTTKGHALCGRLDLARVGMSGHSFGAVTTQAVSGQSFPLGRNFTDARIKAAIPMSPSVPKAGDVKRAFGSVKIPWLLMTGTNDSAPINDTSAASRLLLFPALPPGKKYEIVLSEAHHSVFTDRPVPGEPRNPNHHRVILALSTAFWDAYLRDDSAARQWLDGDGPRTVLEKADRWQKK